MSLKNTFLMTLKMRLVDYICIILFFSAASVASASPFDILKDNEVLKPGVFDYVMLDYKDHSYMQNAKLRILNQNTGLYTKVVVPIKKFHEVEKDFIIFVHECLKENKLVFNPVHTSLISLDGSRSFYGWIFKSTQSFVLPKFSDYYIYLEECF